MSFISLLKSVFAGVANMENGVKSGFRFSAKEIEEIVSISKKENLKYFEILCKMPNLKYFDISFLLSQVDLDDNKIELIKKAQEIYKDDEFKANGQTCSDFIFRTAANLDYLNLSNIEVFKELVKCKNELYDFKNALQNPVNYLTKKESHVEFAFEKIYIEK